MSSASNEDESNNPFASLDLSEIAFPSDGLSIGTIRNAHRELFDVGFGEGADGQPIFLLNGDNAGNAGDTVGSMLYWERQIAVRAYAAALGLDAPWTGLDTDSMKDELSGLYEQYGIAGKHQAAELIRGIEQRAGKLAKQKQK
jgi:hypothetical protein